jgi:hypothetical protein
MCGIVAYLGQREVLEILLRGLQRLEYRYVLEGCLQSGVRNGRRFLVGGRVE